MTESNKKSKAAAAAAASSTAKDANQPKRRQRVETAFTADDPSLKIADTAAEFEAQHVHGVYSNIAQKFSDTRYKPWPKVLEFVTATPPGSILIDVGCGNGKNLGRQPKSAGILEIGCDRSVELLQFATQRNLPVVGCDMLALPFRPGCADRVICIAVLHHLSTPARRLEALRQMFRLLLPGTGRMLVYVWSTEFARSEISKGRADPSVLAAASGEDKNQVENNDDQNNDDDSDSENEKKKKNTPDSTESKEAAAAAAGGADVFVSFAHKSNVTAETSTPETAPGRYYHLFAKGEIEALAAQIDPQAEVAKSWYDCENWAVEVVHRGGEK